MISIEEGTMIGKGNVVVGQSGGPTAVINNSLVGVVHEAMQHSQIGDILGMLHGIAGILNEEFIDLRRESPQTLQILRNTPASALGTVRYRVKDADYERILEIFKAYDVRYFFYIGGNDSADTTHKMHLMAQQMGYELHAIGIPKTVDNDLNRTDHCPGYGSAARFVAAAVRNTGFDTIAMGNTGPIKLMEIMGRNAGWLTAASVLAKSDPDDPPNLIYVPERGASPDKIVADVRACYDRLGYCVVTMSEGLKDAQGQDFSAGRAADVDAFGHARKGGVVEFLEALLKDTFGFAIRYDKPQYLQRSFGELISSTDREEAYEVGRAAVRAAIKGDSDKEVVLVRVPASTYVIEMGLAPLDQVANVERKLPPEFINAEGNGVTDAFVEYARPLIGEPLMPYARLERHRVPVRTKRS
jgi:6-phosphofructokinase